VRRGDGRSGSGKTPILVRGMNNLGQLRITNIAKRFSNPLLRLNQRIDLMLLRDLQSRQFLGNLPADRTKSGF
jgi:hypothetical protein